MKVTGNILVVVRAALLAVLAGGLCSCEKRGGDSEDNAAAKSLSMTALVEQSADVNAHSCTSEVVQRGADAADATRGAADATRGAGGTGPVAVSADDADGSDALDGTTATRSAAHAATRAASIVEKDVLPDTYTIHTTAYFTPTDATVNTAYTYFWDEAFKKGKDSKGNEAWVSTQYDFWPLGGCLDFLCIAVNDAVMPLSDYDAFNWADGKATRSVTVDIPDTQVLQSEVLYASAKPTSGSESGFKTTDVNLTFKHTQALLVFNIECEEADTLIRLDTLVIPDTYMQGRLRVKNPDSGTATASWLFYYDYLQEAYVPGIRHKVMQSSTGTYTCRLLVPAQTAKTMYLHYTRIPYDTAMDKVEYAWNYGSPYVVQLNGSSSSWDAGKKYVYNIKFGKAEQTITPKGEQVTVTEYVTGYTSTYDFNL